VTSIVFAEAGTLNFEDVQNVTCAGHVTLLSNTHFCINQVPNVLLL